MASNSKTLISNQTISSAMTSPSVTLAGALPYWVATLDTTAHTGMICFFTIQGSPDDITWSDYSNNEFAGGDGIGKFGSDLSHQVQSFLLYGAGPHWRINISSLTGTFIVNSLVVTNTDTPS